MIPLSNRAYISAFAASSVNISGPPATLRQLWQSSALPASKRIELPIYGPYHAPHLYERVNISQILCSSDTRRSRTLANYRLAVPLISTSSGTCFDRSLDAPAILTAVVKDILNRPLKLEDVVAGCRDLVSAAHCTRCDIISLGPNSSESMFTRVLQFESEAEVKSHTDRLIQAPSNLREVNETSRTSRRPKLAIVGMAGRFPDAADHERFWDLLEAGLDVHRKVRSLS